LFCTLIKNKKRIFYGAISVIFLIIVYFLIMNIPTFYDLIGSRVNELVNLALGRNVEDTSINTRMRLIEIAIDFFIDKPIFGYGLDSFRLIGPWWIVADNNYLEILVSSGIIGFLIYYSYVILVLKDYLF